MSLTTSTRLGPYEVLALLGAGGMSEVYRARDTRLDRDVAIKVLAASAFADSRRLDRLLREARAISRLNHPHICALYDVGQQDGVTFLVMELLEGKTLADELAKGPLPVDRAIAFGLQMAQALDAAHTRGVIHRDLKPGNVMITRDGVKLLDFGLAKLHEPDESPDSLNTTRGVGPTEEGAVLGTYPYMSPEQLEGREADARSDIFALGVVLYEMATGSRPFQADNRAALTAAILTQTPPPVSTVCAAPPLLDRVIARCLEKDPEARWQSARDLASALRWAMEGDGSQAGPPERARTRGPTWWNWKATVAACLVALLAGAGYLASGLRTVQPAPPAARIILAVLPFVNNSGDEEQDYLSDGMTDEMIAQLGTLQPSRLGVIARTSAMHYKGTTKRADEIASELGAHYLLEGSIRRTGDKVRIAAQLIDARNQSQVWAEQYDRDMRDVLRLQQEVATAIARNMAGNLGVDSSRDLRVIVGAPFEQSGSLRALSAGPLPAVERHRRWALESARAFSAGRSSWIRPTRSHTAAWPIRMRCSAATTSCRLPSRIRSAATRRSRRLQLDDTLSEAHVSLAAHHCRPLLGLGRGRAALQASDRAGPERRQRAPLLFLLSRLHGARRRGVADRRTRRDPGPGVTQRSDERRGAFSTLPVASMMP